MSARSDLQAQFIEAMRGPIITGGRGGVALRFDHGLKPFRDKVLPAISAHGFKVAQAYNPRNWHYDENTGISPADLNSWVASGHVEIMNHSAKHGVADTRKAIFDQIVGGIREIEAQLPAAVGKVWGYAPPGVAKSNWMGFHEGRTKAGWSTYAGRVILQHHAVAFGYMPGTSRRVLDGKPRIGMAHHTIDRLTVPQILDRINTITATGHGLELMLHPSQLDVPGKLTTEGLTTVVAQLAMKQERGELVVLSPYELTIADSRIR